MFRTQETAIKKAFLKKDTTKIPAASEMTKPTPPDKIAARGVILPEARNRMVAEAAYHIAEQRGFAEGSQLEDWLAAEAQINTLMRKPRP